MTLAFDANQNIADAANNALANTMPSGANDNTFELDNTAPTVASIARQDPTASPTNADSLTWRVTFSEAVENVDTTDFTVTGTTATLTVAPVALVTGAYDVSAAGGNLGSLDATVTLSFAAGQNIADRAGNALTNTAPTGANENAFVVDNTAPTVTITGVSATSMAAFMATFTFSEGVAGFAVEDIAVGNGAASAFTGSGGDTEFTALITPTADGEVTVDVAADVAMDTAGNGNTAAAQASSIYDNTAPGVASIERQSPTSSPTNADVLTWRVTFSEAVANVDAADFTVAGTTATLTATAVSGSSAQYDVTVSGGNLAGLNATVTLSFAAGQNIQDAAGNALANTTPTGANEASYVVDNIAPTVTISGVSPTSTAAFTVTITFSEGVNGFAVGDITVGNGAASAFTGSGGDTEFTALITPTADGAVTVDVAADVATDAAGNGNTAATQASSIYDNTAPTVTITGVSATSMAAFMATFTFSEGVAGFAVEDIAVGNGAASAFTGSDGDTEFTALITPTADGEVTVDVAADVATDAAGNGNTAATRVSSTYTAPPTDTVAPTVASIMRQSPTSSPTNADVLTWRVTFSEAVANVDAADFTVAGTTATLTATAVSGSSAQYDVTVSGGNLAGLNATVTLAFVAGQNIQDAAGNALANTTPTGANEASYVVDNIAPTVTISGVSPTSTAAFTVTITFSEGVNGFTVEDITVGNGAASAFTGSGGDTEFTALITPTADGAVTVDVAADVAMDTAGNGNTAAAQASSIYDNTAPTVASIMRQTPTSSPTNADVLTWRVTFSEAVANVDAADFTVAGTTATLTATAVSGSSLAYDVSASGGNLGSLNATVTLSFAGGQNIQDAASNALTATTPTGTNDNTFVVDNTAPTVTITDVPETSTAPFTATFTFSEPVTGFVAGEITLGNATASAFTTTSTTVYTALIAPSASGAVTVDVVMDVATDAAGNGNAAATRGSSTYTAPPTVCNPPDLTGRQEVWQGTLRVGRHEGGLSNELVGYGWYSRTGSLSGRSTPIELGENRRFRIGDTVLLYAHSGGLIPLLVPAPGTLVFHLVGDPNRNAELTDTERAGLALHVCDAKFDFSAATRPGGTMPGEVVPSEPAYAGYDRHYLWENAGLTWSAGLARTLTLSLPVSSDGRAAAAVEGLPALTGPGEDGVYAPGDRIEVRVRFDAPVTVDTSAGAPTLGLALGGVRREAAYEPGQDGGAATELVFALAVSGEDAGAGAAKAIANGIRLNGATIRDEGGADAVLGYGAAPGVVAVEVGAEPSGDGAWTAGEAVEVTLAFAEPVEVGTAEGTPSVGLTLPGAGTRRAVYASGSGTDRLSFAYTLTGADGSVSAALVDPDGLALGGGTIVSTGGLDAVLTHSGAGRTAGPRTPGPVLSVADAEAAEGGPLVFRVTLSPPASGPVTVAYATADGASPTGAAAGEDYTAASGTLTFKPGEREKTVEVAVPDDALGEGAETLMLVLSDATGASIGDGEATGTIGASAGPAALTASFLAVPPEHDGQAPFELEFRLSEAPAGLSYRTVQSGLFDVTGATIARAWRLQQGNDAGWGLRLDPSGFGDVTLALRATTDCAGTPGVCTSDGRMLGGGLQATIAGPPTLTVADAEVREASGAVLDFAVTLSRALTETVTIAYRTEDGSASAGADYTNTTGTLTFAAGETAKTVAVAVIDDNHDEGSETLIFRLQNPSPARVQLADAEATGTINNTDAMPKAWIARFGRTVAEQVLEAVEGRMRATPAPGVSIALAGERIGGNPEPGWGAEPEAEREEEARRDAQRFADWLKDETDSEEAQHRSRAVTQRDLLSGSAFALTAETAGEGVVSFWGRGAIGHFDGREGELTLDGEVETGLLGADWSRGRWSTGLIVSHSSGEGGYSDGSGEVSAAGGGSVEATLTGLFPWARHALSERLEVWGAAGYGAGALTVTPKKPGTDEEGAAIRADLDLRMAAAGLRGTMLDGGGDGLTLTGKTDAMVVQTASGRGRGRGGGGNLEPARATVTRLRLGLEAGRPVGLGGGATLRPSLEVGLRHDSGDAETGFGLDLSGGLALSDPERGLQAELRGRGLLAHRSKGFRDLGFSGSLAWEGKPSSDRGAKLRLTQTVSVSSSGGADSLLSRGTLEGLAANDNGAGGDDDLKSRRLELKLGYGLSAFGDRFTWTPEAGVGLSDTGRDNSLGWRLVRRGAGGGGNDGSLELSFEARRRESANDDTPPAHEVGLRLTARF